MCDLAIVEATMFALDAAGEGAVSKELDRFGVSWHTASRI
jgi:hypothetical protein